MTPPTDTAPPDEAELLEIARAIAEADAKERRGGRREISNLIDSPGKVAEILKPTLGGRLEARAARVIAETRKAGELAEAGGRGGGGGKGKGKAGRGGGGELQGGQEEEEETEEKRCKRENKCMRNRLCTRGYKHRGPCPKASKSELVEDEQVVLECKAVEMEEDDDVEEEDEEEDEVTRCRRVNECMRDSRCTRGYRHGGRCSIPK